ncbi:MAG: AMP-binding protein, partial [Planctomycetaceae bacterium]
SLQTAREALIDGNLVCIFAEGSLTHTGQLQSFQRGMMRIVAGTDAPVVPVYLDELWGSIFSFRGGRFFWKRPRQWPFPVSISFGTPLENPDNVNVIRQAVQNLGVQSVEARKSRQLIPARQFLRQCRGSLFRSKVADSSGAELTGGKLLTGSLLFRRLLASGVIGDDERMVGVLLPPSVGGVIANTALTLMGRVAVNLNYTLSEDVVDFCIKECGIKHVLTSRRFLEKRPYNLDVSFVYLEDLKEQASSGQRLFALLQAMLLPATVLERMLGLTSVKPDDLMTVIFTSGSTGEPKGVMLSHHNVMSNIDAVDQVFHITRDDVLLGVLPFFHSFGYTVTLWLSVTLDPKCVYHFNPLDGRTVGKLSEKHGTTILLSTPTFLRGYLKRCTTEQMHALDLAIVGAEKLPQDLAEAFEEKFGVWPTEGYGATELSPVAAFNVPAHRAGTTNETTSKPGSVGRVMPGASAKIVDPDTGDDLGIDNDGLLMISGPNVMQGYLNRPEKTADVLQDNWYNTGDIARIDNEGFITITGRQSRFSKIGGEMVPHIRVEEELARIVGNPDSDDEDDDQPEILVAVTAVADPKKGERLIVVHKPLSKSIGDVLPALTECGLPNIWIPTADSFLEVENIPLLGTGKLDLKALKDLAIEHFEPQTEI